MTHPMTVEDLQDEKAVEELDCDFAGPLLAAIQHSYEEAKACIEDAARSSWPAAPEVTRPHPGTEKIDLRLVRPPAVRPATPPTAAMSLAARVVAEQPVGEGVGTSAATNGPGRERHTVSAPQEPVARAEGNVADLATTPRRRRAMAAAVLSRWFPGSAALTGSG